jgi:hypothetical protein
LFTGSPRWARTSEEAADGTAAGAGTHEASATRSTVKRQVSS